MPLTSTLTRLDDLGRALSPTGSEEDFTRWWSLVQLIAADVEADPRASKHDASLIADLRAGVSAYIRDLRDGAPTPYEGKARVAISALRSSFAKRSTGTDGWPLG